MYEDMVTFLSSVVAVIASFIEDEQRKAPESMFDIVRSLHGTLRWGHR